MLGHVLAHYIIVTIIAIHGINETNPQTFSRISTFKIIFLVAFLNYFAISRTKNPHGPKISASTAHVFLYVWADQATITVISCTTLHFHLKLCTLSTLYILVLIWLLTNAQLPPKLWRNICTAPKYGRPHKRKNICKIVCSIVNLKLNLIQFQSWELVFLVCFIVSLCFKKLLN